MQEGLSHLHRIVGEISLSLFLQAGIARGPKNTALCQARRNNKNIVALPTTDTSVPGQDEFSHSFKHETSWFEAPSIFSRFVLTR